MCDLLLKNDDGHEEASLETPGMGFGSFSGGSRQGPAGARSVFHSSSAGVALPSFTQCGKSGTAAPRGGAAGSASKRLSVEELHLGMFCFNGQGFGFLNNWVCGALIAVTRRSLYFLTW